MGYFHLGEVSEAGDCGEIKAFIGYAGDEEVFFFFISMNLPLFSPSCTACS